MTALTLDWQDRPYGEIMAEAERIGAIIGPKTNHQIWHTPHLCKPYRCSLVQAKEGTEILVTDTKGNEVAVWFRNTEVEMRTTKVILACRFHQGFADVEAHSAALHAEGELLAAFQREYVVACPTALQWAFNDVQDASTGFERLMAHVNAGTKPTDAIYDGIASKGFRRGREYDYFFDASRRLIVEAGSAPLEEKSLLMASAVQPRFAGKVIVRG